MNKRYGYESETAKQPRLNSVQDFYYMTSDLASGVRNYISNQPMHISQFKLERGLKTARRSSNTQSIQ